MHQGNNLNQTTLDCSPFFPPPERWNAAEHWAQGENENWSSLQHVIKSIRRVYVLEVEHRKRWSGQPLMNCCDQVVYEGSASSFHRQQWIRREQHTSNLQGEDCHRGETFVKPLWKRHKAAVQWHAGSSSGTVTVWYVRFLPGCTAKCMAVLAWSWVPTLLYQLPHTGRFAHPDCKILSLTPLLASSKLGAPTGKWLRCGQRIHHQWITNFSWKYRDSNNWGNL